MSVDYSAVGRRLIRLRECMGHVQVSPFAKHLGVGLKRLWAAENGGPLGKELALHSGEVPRRVARLALPWPN